MVYVQQHMASSKTFIYKITEDIQYETRTRNDQLKVYI